MLAPELLAAMVSGCWAIGALFSANAASEMGAFAFTRWRLFFAMCLLWLAAIYVGRWPELTFESIAWLSVSSWIGILVAIFSSIAPVLLLPLLVDRLSKTTSCWCLVGRRYDRDRQRHDHECKNLIGVRSTLISNQLGAEANGGWQ